MGQPASARLGRQVWASQLLLIRPAPKAGFATAQMPARRKMGFTCEGPFAKLTLQNLLKLCLRAKSGSIVQRVKFKQILLCSFRKRTLTPPSTRLGCQVWASQRVPQPAPADPASPQGRICHCPNAGSARNGFHLRRTVCEIYRIEVA